MGSREYGQFCGLARAAEVLGQRWTMLILRDLLVGPRRYSDLVAGLPGIPTNLLATRLKELERDGIVVREARDRPDRSIVYRLTARGADLGPALDALGRWGAATMHAPRDGEIVTDASLTTALRVAAQGGRAPGQRRVTYTIRVGDAVAHAVVGGRQVEVAPGESPSPDLVITAGPGFRDLLAGAITPEEALADGSVEITGDPDLLDAFVATFVVPYATRPLDNR